MKGTARQEGEDKTEEAASVEGAAAESILLTLYNYYICAGSFIHQSAAVTFSACSFIYIFVIFVIFEIIEKKLCLLLAIPSTKNDVFGPS